MVFKKVIISGICTFTCLLASVIPTFANELQYENIEQYAAIEYIDDSMERMSYIKSGSCGLTISNGVATIRSSVEGVVNVKSTSIVVRLQKSDNNGKTWSTINTWNASGKQSCSISKKQKISKGYYRVHATVKANSESKNIISSEKRY
ncbi:TPA: hypothetical protein KNN52_003556 [Clostridioides difficile]|nr:hypothetical protein [Clostridioides difficile]